MHFSRNSLETPEGLVPSDQLEAFFSNSNVADGIHQKLQLSSEDKAQINQLETQKNQLEEQISSHSQTVKNYMKKLRSEKLKGVKSKKMRASISRGLSSDPGYVKLYQQDVIWKKMCKDLGFPFEPSL